jgi:hypothetical protein
MTRRFPPRARALALSLPAVTLLAIVVAHSHRIRRQARALERRVAGRHARFVESVSADHFQRGNMHTHSTLSDGTASLQAMVGWYRDRGYQFVAMTEHNLRVGPAILNSFAAPGFVLIPGEEVTNRWADKPLHVNALCAQGDVSGGMDFRRPGVGLATVFREIREQGGIPLVNHPNFRWSLTANDIAAGASGRYLLEIWSGHPAVASAGDARHFSAEAIWDDLLARGSDAIPVAVDDAHALPGGDGRDRERGERGGALPGRGWVETFGDVTSTSAICDALGAGHLYASSGPVLTRIVVGGETFALATTDATASVDFIGERGEVFARMRAADFPADGDERELTYRLTGGETLVRARITDSAGQSAWTAAYRVEAEGALE